MTSDMPPAIVWDSAELWTNNFKVGADAIGSRTTALHAEYRIADGIYLGYIRTDARDGWAHGLHISADYNISPALHGRVLAFQGKDHLENRVSGGGVELVLLF